jgi:hypothetical protein
MFKYQRKENKAFPIVLLSKFSYQTNAHVIDWFKFKDTLFNYKTSHSNIIITFIPSDELQQEVPSVLQ